MNGLNCEFDTNETDADFYAIMYLYFLKRNIKKSGIVSHYAKQIDNRIIQDNLFHEHFRLLPLLYKHDLSKLFSELSWKKIESIYKHTYYRNRIQLDRADKFQQYLNSENISSSIILLKGLGLLASVYDDIGCRPMGDIDFFVPGFPVDDQGIIYELISNKKFKLKTDCFRAITFIDQQKFEYDIHRFIADNSINQKISQLSFKHSITVKCKNYKFLTLCPEHQFVTVLYHGITSPGVRYSKRWVVDVLNILLKHSLCHKKIIEFINYFDAPSVLFIGLDELLSLPKELTFNFRAELEKLLLLAKKQLVIETKTYRYFRVLPASPDSGGTKMPVSKLFWLRSVIGFYLISPFIYKKFISFNRYYLSVLNININRTSIRKELLKRTKRRLYYLLWNKWIKN